MHLYVREKRVYVVIAAVLMVTAALAFAQDGSEGTVAEQAVADASLDVTHSPAMVDSFFAAPNDSTAIAEGIKEIIRKERSGFINRVKRSGVGQNYIKGGFFMHFLLTCSLIALVFIIERAWTLSRARVNTKKLMLDVMFEAPRLAKGQSIRISKKLVQDGVTAGDLSESLEKAS